MDDMVMDLSIGEYYETGYEWGEDGERTYFTPIRSGEQEFDYNLDHIRERFRRAWAKRSWRRYW